MSKIYFDAEKQFNQYPVNEDFNISDTVKIAREVNEVFKEESHAFLKDVLQICKDCDFKTVLAIVYNYVPSRYHEANGGDYEKTALYIYLYNTDEISRREFNKLITSNFIFFFGGIEYGKIKQDHY